MVVALLVVSGLGLLAVPAVVRPLGRRIAPDEWARMCALAIASGGVAVELGVVALAAPTVLRAVGVRALADACQRVLGPLTPGGSLVGWAAAAAAVAIPALAMLGVSRARRRCRGARIEESLGDHRWVEGFELVVLPTAHVVAVSVAGSGGQIVITTGLADMLSPEQLDVVLRHEVCHLRHRHHRYLELAAAVEHAYAAFAPARRSTETLRVALERWADEEAAASGPDARGTLRDALLGVVDAMLEAPAATAAFASADTIIERLDALAEPPPRPHVARHAVMYAPGTVLGGSALAGLGAWAGATRHLLAMAGRCPN